MEYTIPMQLKSRILYAVNIQFKLPELNEVSSILRGT